MIIDLVMQPGPVEVALVYVPLSRVKRLDNLLIVRLFDFATLQVKPSTAQRQKHSEALSINCLEQKILKLHTGLISLTQTTFAQTD